MYTLVPICALAVTLAACGASSGTMVEIDGLRARTPSSWSQRPQVRPPQVSAFVLPRARGDAHDAELTIIHYGRGYSGSVGSSVVAATRRWQNRFEVPADQSIRELTRVQVGRVGDVTMTMVDVRGTYLHRPGPEDSDAAPERRPDHRLIGVVLETRRGPYFLRLIGPARTIARHEQAFERWVRSLE